MQDDLFQTATSSQQDTHASHLVRLGSDEARKMTVTSGRKYLPLCKRSGRLGAFSRMFLDTSVWASTKCYLTWKAKATPSNRLLFQLAPSMPRTDETGSGLWPTPRASEWKGTGPLGSKSHNHRLEKGYLDATVQERNQVSGSLNPAWVEHYLMGYPRGWTNLETSQE